VRAIAHCAPDVLGVQECFAYQAEFLAAALPGYAWVGRGREADGSGEMAAVFFRRDRFEPLAEGHFWLSKTPAVPGSRSWGSHCVRVATWVRLRLRASGSQVLVCNTHLDHGSEEARVGGARLLVERLPRLAPGAPLIVTGDFNATAEDSATWQACVDAGLRDAWLATSLATGPDETWCDFRAPRHNVRQRIDWILVQGPVAVQACQTVTYQEAGGFPSDHLPVRAVIDVASRSQPLRRTAARALLLTPERELLLMCAEDPGDGHCVWFAPGGGLEPGETDLEGLRRELAEETGQTTLPIGPLVWTRFHAFTWAGGLVEQHERFYLVRTARFEPSMRTNPSQTELLSFRQYRWWRPEQIEASAALFAPRRLAALLQALLTEGPPSVPTDAGV
jgi:endonuclease/exonuclease/phosphatase family metal-dependent hydrolase/8-oxo-dGTP pyrophosphatase MutT (NUDIX family)